jgi:hypothetical protein
MTFIILRAPMPTQELSAVAGAPGVFTRFPRSWRSRIQSALDLRRHASRLPTAFPCSSPTATFNMPTRFRQASCRHAPLLLVTVSSWTVGIVLSEHTDEDGATIFRQACKLGLEGIVSKRLSAPNRSGPSRDWLKVKNPDSPAMIRAREVEW